MIARTSTIKRDQTGLTATNSEAILQDKNSQTHLNRSAGSFSAIDLTPSDTSIFTDYNWRVYTDPCSSDHYPIIMENSTIKKFRTTSIKFQKSKLAILQKLCLITLIPESNTNQEEPIIHFTDILINIANKTSPKNHNIFKTQ